jgi:hypothetical protein
MPVRSLDDRIRAIDAALGGEARFVDVALALTRAQDHSTLLYAGGVWDKFDRRFTGKEPSRTAVIELEESQIEFTRWFETFLADYRNGYPRDISLVLNSGGRRGGKTFDTLACQIAALIDVPMLSNGLPTIGWAISKTYRQRDELEQFVSSRIPSEFYEHQRAPEHRYTFAHGAYLRNLSADEPESLKQGRVDFLFYNEGQLMSPKAIKHGLYGTSDCGGLTMMAANPPDGPEGDWLRDLKDAIEEDPEIRPIAKFFNFDPRKNTKVDAPARRRNAKLAQKIDPEGADGDDEGTWRRWGDLAYPGWNSRTLDRGGLVGPAPTIGAVDITSQVTRSVFYIAYPFVIGGDFQRRPQAAAVLRVFDVPGIEGPVYWFVDECGVKGTEVELSTELMGSPHGYVPQRGEERSAVWVGDCSGSYQGAERIPGRTSFGLLEAEGWKVFPAEIIKGTNSERPKNPDVAQRLGLMYRLMEAQRIRVAPECTWLTAAFAKCQLRKTETGTRVPKGAFAHITDAASYAVWRLDPKPGSRKMPPPRGSMIAVDSRPRGPRIV